MFTLIDHCIEILHERQTARTISTMYDLAAALNKGIDDIEDDDYNSMMFSLQEVVKDVAEGACGSMYRKLVDPTSRVYEGPGCIGGLERRHAIGRSKQQQMCYLVKAIKRIVGLEWAEYTDVEHFVCEYNKYSEMVAGRQTKPYRPERWIGQGHGNGFLDAAGHLKSLQARKQISRQNQRSADGHAGKCVAPRSALAKRQKKDGNRNGGHNSGYADKSPREVARRLGIIYIYIYIYILYIYICI